ncbi:MAG: hypothetical protein PHE56_16725 [Bacteroidales bacterium]|nr:hypothetical protein [Bacteroidales bacterium]
MRALYFVLMILFSTSIIAQSIDSYSTDEVARMKFAVHLITYDTIGGWENAAGEAYYNIIISSFKENCSIPDITSINFTDKDKYQISVIIGQLNALKQNPPSWDELMRKETQYLIYLDRALRRNTKYKSAVNP